MENEQRIDFAALRVAPTLDDIAKALKNKKLVALPNVIEACQDVVKMSGELEQFNFGKLTSEVLDEAHKESFDFIEHGCFQLPYKICFYRYTLIHDGIEIGGALLNVGGDDNAAIDTVMFIHNGEYITAMNSRNGMKVQGEGDARAIQVGVAEKEIEFWQERIVCGAVDRASKPSGLPTKENLAEGSINVMGLTMILNTRGVRKERLAPPAKPNKARERKGLPLLPYTTRVYTDVYMKAAAPGPKGTHASPRPHRRRAHVRHYPKTDKHEAYIKPVAAMLVNWDGQPLQRGAYEVPTPAEKR